VRREPRGRPHPARPARTARRDGTGAAEDPAPVDAAAAARGSRSYAAGGPVPASASPRARRLPETAARASAGRSAPGTTTGAARAGRGSAVRVPVLDPPRDSGAPFAHADDDSRSRRRSLPPRRAPGYAADSRPPPGRRQAVHGPKPEPGRFLRTRLEPTLPRRASGRTGGARGGGSRRGAFRARRRLTPDTGIPAHRRDPAPRGRVRDRGRRGLQRHGDAATARQATGTGGRRGRPPSAREGAEATSPEGSHTRSGPEGWPCGTAARTAPAPRRRVSPPAFERPMTPAGSSGSSRRSRYAAAPSPRTARPATHAPASSSGPARWAARWATLGPSYPTSSPRSPSWA